MGKKSRRQHHRALQRQLADKAARRAVEQQREPLTKFSYTYGPEFLAGVGPVFMASWGVPRALADALAATGQPIPSPIPGAVLIDTGADGTAISLKVASELGLKPTRMQAGFGAGGHHNNPVFFASFTLSISDGSRRSADEFNRTHDIYES